MNFDKKMKIIEYYGEKHQRFKAAEELSELQTLILQDANKNGKVPKSRIIEEIADVYVMLSQLKTIYCIDSRDIEPIIDAKVERTLRQIEGEQNEQRQA